MRQRTARLIELDKKQRNKFLEMLRNFIKEETGQEVDEAAYIVPDVDFNSDMVAMLKMGSSNPFMMEPAIMQKLLETAQYTFTWYTYEGEAEPAPSIRGTDTGSTMPYSPWDTKTTGDFGNDEDDEDPSIN